MSLRSASQVLEYDTRCRHAYYLKRIERVEAEPAAWTAHGLAGHHALLDVWEAGGRRHGTAEIQQEFVTEYRRLIREYDQGQPDRSQWLRGGRKTTDNDIADREALGIQQVADYMVYVSNEGLRPMIIDGRPAVELPFSFDLEGKFGTITVRGYIDAAYEDVYGTPFVRDLKFGNRPKSNFQIQLYGYAMRHCFGIDVQYGDFFLCKQNAPTFPLPLCDLPDNVIEGRIIDMDAAETLGYYNPAEGDQCRMCDVQKHCRFFV